VGIGQGLCNLRRDRQRFWQIQHHPALLEQAQPILQVLPGDERHDDIEQAGIAGESIDLHDPRMIKGGDSSRLLHKTFAKALLLCDVTVHNFDRHRAVEGHVLAAKDGSHPTLAEQLLNAIGVVQYGSNEAFH